MNMNLLTKELNRLFGATLIDLERARQKRELEAIRADPRAHKATLLWSDGKRPNYRYWGDVVNGKGQRVRFCWSTTRNAAGFFMGWRETVRKNRTVKRDMFVSRRVRERVKDIARQRTNALRAKMAARAAPVVVTP